MHFYDLTRVFYFILFYFMTKLTSSCRQASRIDDAVSELVATITSQATRSSRSRCDTAVKVRWFVALATIAGLPAPGWRLRVFSSLLSAVEKHAITLSMKSSCGGTATQSHKVGGRCGCPANSSGAQGSS